MGATRKRKADRPRTTRLDRLIEEAIVDAYGESEQLVGLYTTIENNLALPFETMVLGVTVTVVRIDLTPRDEIVAVCRRGGMRQTVPILDLLLPPRRPAGADGLTPIAVGQTADSPASAHRIFKWPQRDSNPCHGRATFSPTN